MPSHSVFVYGTLLEPERQKDLLGRLCPMTEASVAGYRCCLGKWPYIVPDTAGAVRGAVITALSDDDLVKLDAYEDVASNQKQALYERQRLDVQLENGHIVATWVYMPVLGNWDRTWLEGNA